MGDVVEGGAAASGGCLLGVRHSAALVVYLAGEESGVKNKAGGLSLDRHACEVRLAANGLRPFNPDEPGRFDKRCGHGWGYGERLVDEIERPPAAAEP